VTSTPENTQPAAARLHRTLGLWNLIIIGMVIVQPVAPFGLYGIVSNKAHGHVVTAILIAMVAMLFTAIGYGKMARVYPSAGSAYTYVGQEINSAVGYVVGWSIVMSYVFNPLICTAICSYSAMGILPGVGIPFYAWVLFFAAFFTWTNLRGVETSAQMNNALCAVMMVVVVIFLAAVLRAIWGVHHDPGYFTHPFYDPSLFKPAFLFAGTSVAVLTYIGFDAISTLSEEVKDPKRNVMRATVLVCLITGFLSAIEVYAAQLIWGAKHFDIVETAFAQIGGQAGGVILFHIIIITVLVANMGSGMGSQLAAGRLLYGMGRSNALPKSFFAAIEPKNRIPRNNILLIGGIALVGSALMEFFKNSLGAGAYEIGAQVLCFGTLIAFMGVNASSFVRQWRHPESSNPITRLLGLIVPTLGFLVCAFLWWNLSPASKWVGFIWMALGIAYGAVRTRGFRSELVNFDIPADEA
jgi:amino acid transporter